MLPGPYKNDIRDILEKDEGRLAGKSPDRDAPPPDEYLHRNYNKDSSKGRQGRLDNHGDKLDRDGNKLGREETFGKAR